MKRAQKAKFQKAGWTVGSAADLLGLNEAEAALVEAKLSLGDAVRTVRRRRHMTQAGLAKLMDSSQSRVAKVENRDPEVSLDLQLKAIFAAEPTALADFQGLIRKWSGRKAGTTTRRGESRGGRRQPRSSGRRPRQPPRLSGVSS